MKARFPWVAMAGVLVLAGSGCSKKISMKPPRPLAAGTVMFHFTNKVQGPLELVIDDTRIPVPPSRKPSTYLVVSGLSVGRHHYFLASPMDAFGPDRGEFEMPQDRGVFLVNFAQRYNATLYGNPEPLPPSQGIPGVLAHLER